MAASGDLGTMYYDIEVRLDKAKKNVDDYEKYNLAAIERIRKAWDNVSRASAGGGGGSGSLSSSIPSRSAATYSVNGAEYLVRNANLTTNNAARAAENADRNISVAYERAGRAQADAIRETSDRTVQSIKTGALHPALRGQKNSLARDLAASNPAIAQRIADKWGTTVDDLFNYIPPARRAKMQAQAEYMGVRNEADIAYKTRTLTDSEMRGEEASKLGPATSSNTSSNRTSRGISPMRMMGYAYAAEQLASVGNSYLNYYNQGRIASLLTTSQQRDLAQAQGELSSASSLPFMGLRNLAASGMQKLNNRALSRDFGSGIANWFTGQTTTQDVEYAVSNAQESERRRIAARDFNFSRSALNRSTKFGVASANATEDVVAQRRIAIQQQYEEATSSQSLNKIMETAQQAGLNPQDAIAEAKANAAKTRQANNNALDHQIYYANRDNTNSAAVSNLIEQQKYRESKVLELRNKHIQELTTTPVTEIATKQREQAAQMSELTTSLDREKRIIERGINAEVRATELRVNHAGKLAQRVELEAKLQTDYQQADAADKNLILIRNQRLMAAFNAQWQEEEGVSLMMGGSRIRQNELQASGRNFAAQREAIIAERDRRFRVELPNAQDKEAVKQQILDESRSQLSVLNRQERLSRQDVMFGTESLERQNRVWDAKSMPDRRMRERSAEIMDRLEQYRMQIERNPELKDVLSGQRNEFVRGQLLSLTRSAPEGRVMNPLSVIGSPTGGSERQSIMQELGKAYTGDNKEIIRLLAIIAGKGNKPVVSRATP